MTPIYESDLEQALIDQLVDLGYTYLSPEQQESLRPDLSSALLLPTLTEALQRLNPGITPAQIQAITRKLSDLPPNNLVQNNRFIHQFLTDGVTLEVLTPDGMRGKRFQLIDHTHPEKNTFTVTNQYTLHHNNQARRPDVVILVNGIPLVVIELKNPTDENATVQKAYQQLVNYTNAIPALFHTNAFMVASDGYDAIAGTITSPRSRFIPWKEPHNTSNSDVQLVTLAQGMLPPRVLLDILRHFIAFETTTSTKTGAAIQTNKLLAAYHQYHVVNKAITSTTSAIQPTGSHKIGIVWHTQGSGKSLSMLFYAGKAVLQFDNPTIIVITDRNDLDDQLFDTFSNSRHILRQEPRQASSRDNLKDLLRVAGGGVIFTTLQKFLPEDRLEFDTLSTRHNIIVIADEAHRSHYGFNARISATEKAVTTTYGYAKYLRDAVPNASFIGFTGTPIENADHSTRQVFGDYLDVYDIAQAVEDGATVPIYYESRLAKIHLKEEEKQALDEELESITENEEATARERSKAKWAQIEAIIGNPTRVANIANDIVTHFEARSQIIEGKALIVSMSRRIAVDLYDQIVALRPEWQTQGKLKVVMTTSSSDPAAFQPHATNKQQRKELAEQFKDPNDPLQIVIVRDMWLTGFDAPSLSTMYLDKPMRGHNLMQAIARVNRVFHDKPGGLIVDYIGIAADLKQALADYTTSGGKGDPTLDQALAIQKMVELHEVILQLFHGLNFREFFTQTKLESKLKVILNAQDHILGLENGSDRFIKATIGFAKAFSLSLPDPKALALKDDLAFFQAVKARLTKLSTTGSGRSEADIELAIKQLVDQAIVVEGIVDILAEAGIKKTDISILSDEFLLDVAQNPHQNLAAALLQKLLNDEIKVRTRSNLTQSKKFSEMLQNAITRYQNRVITAAQFIQELIDLARIIRDSNNEANDLHLSVEEFAFYSALSDNNSALELLGKQELAAIAVEVFNNVRKNATIDWAIKDSARAKLRVAVRRVLRKFGYPPDLQETATQNIIKQAELLASTMME